ncbi:TraE family protein [Christensenellaceae bacterium OttesenSCG-928-M15]|nr:TraE family protein [Christensenellaceae bacterium OttesenSCG-928-M15]
MPKTIQRAVKLDQEPLKIPRSAQQIIPIRRIWQDGIFLLSNSKYAKTWSFTDINYASAGKDDKSSMFLDYCELINALDSGAATKITISNKALNREEFEKAVLLQHAGDDLDEYRTEYNGILNGAVAEANNIVKVRYITVSIHKKSVEEAKSFFNRIGSEIMAHLAQLSSTCLDMDAESRLRSLYEFFHGEDAPYSIDLPVRMRLGHGFRDFICPDSVEIKADHFKIGERYGRVLYLKDYANYIRDTFVSELCDLPRSLFFSIDILPIPTDEAVREVEMRLLGVETNVANFQRRQNKNFNYMAEIPYDLQQARNETKEMLDDLTSRDQHMLYSVMTLLHMADSKAQLDSDTESLMAVARKHLCQLAVLRFQQLDGLNTALPYGLRKINAFRTLSTESVAVFTPFQTQEITHPEGVYCGKNSISGNIIMVNPSLLQNGNTFVLGLSGSGKSMTLKNFIVNYNLRMGWDVICIDAEREYAALTRALHGEIIDISANSKNHINAMELSGEYGDGDDPITAKSEFMLSFIEMLVGKGNLGAREKSIVDRCVANTYRAYAANGYKGEPPTLMEFYADLKSQPEQEARDIALALELFTSGSLNIFAKQNNVDVNARLLTYDIHELGKSLQSVGILVILDSIFNRLVRNRAQGRRTVIILDELWLLFQHEYAGAYLSGLWKRIRKYGGFICGATQCVTECLGSANARTMLSNSEWIVMLNQSAADRSELSNLLNISDVQVGFFTNSDVGCGVMKIGNVFVPFNCQLPNTGKLYHYMTTKPGEGEAFTM